GKAEGARVAAGGEAPDGAGYFVRPTVLSGARDDMRIVREEIFGPVVAVQPFDEEAEVLRAANANSYGLAAYLWTNDLSRAHRLSARMQAGSVEGYYAGPRGMCIHIVG